MGVVLNNSDDGGWRQSIRGLRTSCCSRRDDVKTSLSDQTLPFFHLRERVNPSGLQKIGGRWDYFTFVRGMH